MKQIILTEKNFSKLKDLVKKNKVGGGEIVFRSEDDDLNRKVLEKLDIDVLLIPLSGRKDYMKQRNSGFNEIMARIAKRRGIKVGIDLDELVLSKNGEEIFSRLRQNIILCKKNKIQMRLIVGKEKRDSYDLRSFGLVLGMPTWMVKNLV